MAEDELFASAQDYNVPLLRLLAELPAGQGEAGGVISLFGERFGQAIPEVDRAPDRGGRPVWKGRVRRARRFLLTRGLVAAPEHGVWRITDAGRQWLADHPDAKRIGLPRVAGSSVRRRGGRQSGATLLPGITLEVLEQTRKLLPAEQFRQLWGPLYDQMLAQERAKAITEISRSELGRRAERWLNEVHAFLRGQNAGSPSSEVVCDWIHFCYALELYREAAALLPYVHEDEVDPAVYKRARRIAEVCRGKLGR